MRPRTWPAVSALAAVAVALRLWNLDRSGFDQDELATLHFALQPMRIVLFGPGFDNHPPLYYGLMHLWLGVFGSSEVALRFPSVLLGAVAAGLAFVLGRRLLTPAAGWCAGLAVMLLPPQLSLSQYGRMYELLIVLALFSMWSLTCLMERPTVLRAVGYIIATELMLYTQSAAIFIVVAQNVGWIAVTMRGVERRWSPPWWLLWVVVQAVILALHVPWLVVASHRLDAIQDGFWVKRESVVSYMGGLVFIYAGSRAVLASYVLAPAFTLLAALGIWRGRARPHVAVLVAFAAVPGLVAAVVSQLSQPIFVPKSLMPSAIAVYWLAGLGVSSLRPRLRGAVGLILVGAALTATAQFESMAPAGQPDLRAAFRRVIPEVEAGNAVFLQGFPSGRRYFRRIWVESAPGRPVPLILTSEAATLDAALYHWCDRADPPRLIAIQTANLEYAFDGLTSRATYLALFARESLVADGVPTDFAGQSTTWHCDLGLGASLPRAGSGLVR